MKRLDREPSENARTYAVRVLLFNIINLELPPGTAVSENELSAALTLSRTPVREALIELSKLGLVNILPQRGSYVTRIDYELIEEARFMRLVLENAVLKLACEQGISEEYREKLKQNLEMEKQYLESGDSALLLELDNTFHRLLFESVNKARTYRIVHAQMIHFDRLRVLSLKSLKSSRTLQDHENILYALERRDGELAEMIMTRHLTRYQVKKEKLLQEYPDYFL
ncbi:MAG: GntR family transcriptional regulator [Lachnospiraceae bacterium]|nr:GntR family transcriptional regulator [Lachnospiraceae bacterium]